jgi:hypothetical protein
MKICHECKFEIPQDQLCHDMFGGAYHPQCYIDARPPYPGPEEDPERRRAFQLSSQSST